METETKIFAVAWIKWNKDLFLHEIKKIQNNIIFLGNYLWSK